MSRAQLSLDTLSHIYSAWTQGVPPTRVATALRIKLSTVIAEYVRLDDALYPHQLNQSTKETSHG